jgi:ribose-phosphate pyrophosphokinase
MGNHKLKFFACRDSRYLAEKIASSYGLKLGDSSVLEFSDGEFQPAYNESIRGCTVFIVQSTFPPTDNLMELLLMIDAAKRASAHRVIAVIPYFGWARQDRKDRPRVSIGAKLVANLLRAAGVDRIMTMDLHADQIQGFFDMPVDHLYASGIFAPYIQKLGKADAVPESDIVKDLVIAAPDVGGAKRANAYASYLDAPMVICHKQREKANVVGKMTVIGDVVDKDVIILDDMIDTAGTITKAADMMIGEGAASVRAAVTHAVLSGPAYERINASKLKEVIVTDTIPLKKGEDVSKFTVLSVADLFADVIGRVYNYEEISSRFIF